MRRTNNAPRLSHDAALQDAIAHARNAIGNRNVHAAVRILSARLDDQRDFHNAILSLLDSSPNQMRQELIKEALNQRPDFSLNIYDKEGKTVLDVAVKHKDQEFARYLLGQGAKPEQVSLGAASHDMQALLTSWRRKNLLYAHFNERNKQSWTPLDRTLYEDRHEEARARLEHLLTKNDVHKVWEEAIHAGRHDVLRALLVTGTPDELRKLTKDKYLVGQWKEALQDDPGLSAVLKEFPYQSAKRGKPENLNTMAKFTGTNESIDCLHLATYQQMQQAQDSRIKFNYTKFSKLKSIENNVKPDIEKTYETLKEQASEVHLIDNKRFGQFLARQFDAMEKNGKQSKLMLLHSTNHAMNLGLMIKEKDDKKSYVVKFFDPNETTTGTHSKTNHAKTFETQTLASYITEAGALHAYYPEPVGMSLIFVRTEDETQKSISTAHSSRVNRTLTSMDIDHIDATVMWHLIREGFTGNLRKLHDYFSSLPEDKRIELLSCKHEDGTPALFMSMQDGKTESVKAFGELLKLAEPIPQDKLFTLIAAKDVENTPALFRSMQGGKTESVKAFGELLKLFDSVPQDQLFMLIAAKDAENTPALSISMENRHAETVKAWGELLKLFESMPQDQLFRLIAATDAEGTPALFISMQNGDAESVKAYGDVMKLLPPDKQADLLLSKIHLGLFMFKKLKSGFQIAVENGHFRAANELLQLLTQLAPTTSPGKRAELREELKDYEKIFGYSIWEFFTAHQERSKMKKLFAELKSGLGE